MLVIESANVAVTYRFVPIVTVTGLLVPEISPDHSEKGKPAFVMAVSVTKELGRKEGVGGSVATLPVPFTATVILK